MNKFYLFFTLISMVLIGCSSDSDSLQINEENLLGKWYFKGTSIDNGPLETHDHSCPTSRDYQEILSSHNVKHYRHGTDCGVIDIISAAWTLEGNQFTTISDDPTILYPSVYKVLSITEEQLVLSRDFHPISPSETEIYKYYYTRN